MQSYNAAPCNSNMLGYKLPFEESISEKGSYQSRINETKHGKDENLSL